ncbi:MULTISPECIES: HlyD family secretion protein [unclassified Mesorhizobium]|uniref:HlyD family secretion protein n=1 Tax=unclassified Mesorhizobium TaxID=325217 RepID=UPI001CCF7D5F|nr:MULTISPECIES: HlyD family secretion protein [unclassified Mesorhizobium]MBZ9735741.1 HlyD family secretion protein [Mesorhizobium sp. CA9]MBZ9817364.1 HlyD family secretion protein [Mesorhizobium sp. CA7]MBZ9827658.1 HlyD family secretion protein [Mesorhizobium sp. CA18]MBZ9833360.1 HlyD family secretion protein [Mesorhizobium sp. CA2]MBZ9839629.1 HlyD family secretion protein [Mesorhizobium sp. CA3]
MSRVRRIAIVIVVLFVTSLAASWGWQWFTIGRFEETTDNAYLRGDITSIAPKLAGYVVEVDVDDNASVLKGAVLFRVDDNDYRAKVEQAKANAAARKAEVDNIVATSALQKALIVQADAQRQSAAADLQFARSNLDRYVTLQRNGTASDQKLEDAHAAYDKAKASVDGADANVLAQRLKLDVLGAQLASAEAAQSQAQAALDLAMLDLSNTVVKAPIDGIVGNRQIRVGRYVTAGTAALDIVPVKDVWIVANFKETQLEQVNIGQRVRVTVDEYPDLEIDGVVDSFSPGSGAAFSLLPPDNATGNFIRVVQRVPVKIRIMRNPLPGRLVPGLSARVAIAVSAGDAWAAALKPQTGGIANGQPIQ